LNSSPTEECRNLAALIYMAAVLFEEPPFKPI